MVGGLTGGRDGWPGTETVLTTSEYGATLQKGQLLSHTTHTRSHTHKILSRGGKYGRRKKYVCVLLAYMTLKVLLL